MATVSKTGKVKCKKSGTATITIKAAETDTYQSASKKVKVIAFDRNRLGTYEGTYTYTDLNPDVDIWADDPGIDVTCTGTINVSYLKNGKMKVKYTSRAVRNDTGAVLNEDAVTYKCSITSPNELDSGLYKWIRSNAVTSWAQRLYTYIKK